MADIEFRYLDEKPENTTTSKGDGNLIPKEVSQLGSKIRTEIPKYVPEEVISPAQSGVDIAENTLKSSVFPSMVGPLSQRMVERPAMENIVGAAGAYSPIATGVSMAIGAALDSPKGVELTKTAQSELSNGVFTNKELVESLDMLGRATNIYGKEALNGASYLAKTMPRGVFHDVVKTLAQVGSYSATDTAVKYVAKKLAMTELGKTIGNLKDPIGFDSKVRNRLFESKRNVYDKFGKEINDFTAKNPQKTVNLRGIFEQLNDDASAAVNGELINPSLRKEVLSAAKSTKNNLLLDLLENPENASSLTLKDVQEIKNSITQIPSIARKLRSGKFADFRPGDRYLLDLVDDLNNEIIQLHPGMSEVKDMFADYMYKYHQVKGYFSPKSLLQKLRNGFTNEVVYKFTKDVLDDSALVKQIDNFRRASKVIKFGQRIGMAGASIYALKKTLGSLRRGGESENE